MSEKDDRLLRERNLAFFGAVTASLSHELNNVYTIINELSGLLEDFMVGAEQGVPLKPERIKGAVEKIGAQVQRGKVLVKRLNSFAHSADEAVAAVSLRELLDRITAIAQRLATLKRAKLECEFPDEDVELTTNPFVLQQVVFSAIRMALEAVDEKRIISVSYEKSESGSVVVVSSADPVSKTDDEDAERAVLALLMRELGGTAEYVPGADDSFCFRFVLPRALPHSNS
jgi:C4-dicarboxylate-specific signal transduction histidine kinase